MRTRRALLVLLAAIAAFGVVRTLTVHHFRWPVWNWLLDVFERLGFPVYRISGALLLGPNGPFHDSPRWVGYAHHYAVEVLLALPALCLAISAFCLLALRRRGGGASRRDGHTHCGACDYILKGLTEPRCPECGRAI